MAEKTEIELEIEKDPYIFAVSEFLKSYDYDGWKEATIFNEDDEYPTIQDYADELLVELQKRGLTIAEDWTDDG